ncbi:hypothetical protein [Streptomyces sp. 061-3]|uniref:hypothetical protein n=1 Tax=Streptomyces sp. 061-3 TaxID=2789268 RepID=UPI003980B7A8
MGGVLSESYRCQVELDIEDAYRLTGLTPLAVGATWPYIKPSQELVAAYPEDPVVVALHVGFAVARQFLEVAISGLLAWRGARATGAGPSAVRQCRSRVDEESTHC